MQTFLYFKIKRIIDISGSAAGIILLSPVLMFIAVSIWFSMGFPIIFRQKRPGLDNEPFVIYKFRTMRPPIKGENPYYSDRDRMTGIGRILRKMSLDELPELWNVFKGDMSLVGPRPLLLEYLDKYTERQKRRHDVRPGITGWAQINGRTAVSMSKKLEMDLWYVDNCTLWLDFKIVMVTVLRVVLPGASVIEQDHDTIDDLKFLKKDRSVEVPVSSICEEDKHVDA